MASTIERAFDQVFSDLYDEDEFNGVVLLTHNGQISYKKAFGIANIEDETPLRTTSIFNLASVSKQFTAVCVMLLAERRKLRYDDPITDYLHELPYTNVTIRHLLHHTSGLAAYENVLEEYWDGDADEDFVTNDVLLELYAANEIELDARPGRRYEYSNTGYAFLASIVERASGQRFEDFIRENIFEPLQLSDSFAHRRPARPPKRIARGFTTNDDGEYEDYTYNYMDGIVGDGNVFCSAEDLAVYTNALFSGQVVRPNTMREALQRGELNNGEPTEYGFGWDIESDTYYSHTGCWEAYNNYLGVDTESGYVYIVLSSGDNGGIFEAVEEAMADFYE